MPLVWWEIREDQCCVFISNLAVPPLFYLDSRLGLWVALSPKSRSGRIHHQMKGVSITRARGWVIPILAGVGTRNSPANSVPSGRRDTTGVDSRAHARQQHTHLGLMLTNVLWTCMGADEGHYCKGTRRHGRREEGGREAPRVLG